ncbi:I78 family peptidase inhibitor [Paracoccus shandongensis]|uniref:I78 family peptidase inhibitor n=1 Tax=Paracoccus shandongensis TaxID=2816048 RepID=UPI001A9081C2|nr:I78 family peptidase inhibitor [Paracoccus shandongensis]
MRLMLVLPLVLLAAACKMEPAATPPAVPPTAACDEADLSARFLGRSQEEVQATALPGARIIQPNSPVTMDHRPERANFELDAKGRVTRVFCG